MPTNTLSLQIVGAEPIEARHIEHATRSLRRELDALHDVQTASLAGAIPALAKAGGAIEIGQIALTLLGSGGVAVGVVSALKDWLLRNRRMKLRVKKGDMEIELDVAGQGDLEAALTTVHQMLDGPDTQASLG